MLSSNLLRGILPTHDGSRGALAFFSGAPLAALVLGAAAAGAAAGDDSIAAAGVPAQGAQDLPSLMEPRRVLGEFESSGHRIHGLGSE